MTDTQAKTTATTADLPPMDSVIPAAPPVNHETGWLGGEPAKKTEQAPPPAIGPEDRPMRSSAVEWKSKPASVQRTTSTHPPGYTAELTIEQTVEAPIAGGTPEFSKVGIFQLKFFGHHIGIASSKQQLDDLVALHWTTEGKRILDRLDERHS